MDNKDGTMSSSTSDLKPISNEMQHQLYHHFGRLVGVATRHKIPLPLSLSSIFWKVLCNLPITRKDLDGIDRLSVQTLDGIEKRSLNFRNRKKSKKNLQQSTSNNDDEYEEYDEYCLEDDMAYAYGYTNQEPLTTATAGEYEFLSQKLDNFHIDEELL